MPFLIRSESFLTVRTAKQTPFIWLFWFSRNPTQERSGGWGSWVLVLLLVNPASFTFRIRWRGKGTCALLVQRDISTRLIHRGHTMISFLPLREKGLHREELMIVLPVLGGLSPQIDPIISSKRWCRGTSLVVQCSRLHVFQCRRWGFYSWSGN